MVSHSILPPLACFLLFLLSSLFLGREGTECGGGDCRPPRSRLAQLGPRLLPRRSPCPRAGGGRHFLSASVVLAVECPCEGLTTLATCSRRRLLQTHSVLHLPVVRHRRELVRVVLPPLRRRRKLMRTQLPRRRRKLMRATLTSVAGVFGLETSFCVCGPSTRLLIVAGQLTS